MNSKPDFAIFTTGRYSLILYVSYSPVLKYSVMTALQV